ncbi:unnamed protein product [Caenorhabditis nigoni]
MEDVDNEVVVDLTDDNEVEADTAQDDVDSENLYGQEDPEASQQNGEEEEEGAPENPINLDDEDEAEATENAENTENGAEKDNEDNGEEEENPFADDDDSDEDGGGVQVTIRKIEPTEKPAARQGKLDLDTTAMINDKPIYDLDLATMEDRPWRKPGADITDYFNYGFTEETWNLYCERQKKLRAEFAGNQAQANTALFSAIKISNPLANPVINPSSSVVKVLTDNGGRFKQPQQPPAPSPIQNEQVIRTVISGNPQSAPSLMDFTRPPPGMSLPPPAGFPAPVSAAPTVSEPIFTDAPPGVESDLPPGVESAAPPPSFGGGLDLNLGLPPMGFNPNMPPPGMPPMGMMSTSMPPPGFSMPPPGFPSQHSRAGFGPGPVSSVSSRGMFGGLNDDDDDERRLRRKRSRSRSPRRDDRRDRDSRRRGDDRRRHRSRSTSGDRRRRRDDRDREKRRDRRDDDDRKKSSRSRREDEDDRRSEKKRDTRSRDDDEPTGTNEEASSPVAD